ncbi:type IV pilus biogenesis protein EbsA [Thermosynechococcus vestitus]|uniref:Tlr2025 protein n=1 Tax=Thermosynechococcus vestitus (strain NIES-2133 / IAM M-273 / BP-1) TaxID=197221 RepID=Q8DHD4_THEVB|nr:type IV pilus biogenesis protein EbsA [Thermosynechococcus vestitus]BAC09577.1 tlr2025 [Thermosynechococcus vestitus BP-1]BAY52968.1 hypothetical protein NIES2134_119520 [Thermostichus vulcanus NIES-2134]
MTALDRLQPANPREVNIFAPYMRAEKRPLLPLGIALYRLGRLEGQRGIEGGNNVDFVATWTIANLPADLSRCTVTFDNSPDLQYEMSITTFELVDYLIDVIINYKKYRIADFSKAFYRKLLRLE